MQKNDYDFYILLLLLSVGMIIFLISLQRSKSASNKQNKELQQPAVYSLEVPCFKPEETYSSFPLNEQGLYLPFLLSNLKGGDRLIFTFYHDENGKPYLALNSMSSDFYILGAVLNFQEDETTKYFNFTWEHTDQNNVCTQLEVECYKFSLGKGGKNGVRVWLTKDFYSSCFDTFEINNIYNNLR